MWDIDLTNNIFGWVPTFSCPYPSPICSELPCDLRNVEALKHLNSTFTSIVQLKTQNNPPEEYKEAKFGLNVVQQDKGSK